MQAAEAAIKTVVLMTKAVRLRMGHLEGRVEIGPDNNRSSTAPTLNQPGRNDKPGLAGGATSAVRHRHVSSSGQPAC